ncbi:hypothetical protein PGTUg99_023221 [Puccinia graminis f. sp. tritici]|uniref:Uncharacterized protein n=1 Tax=Puccinia graminis f. sp. tritici TaxID=56615 RepID=A0A5B0PNS8_PUCGR|nr:hypothetical protein PGTUg99_023221 [Puccinia graminis f. sp. tritici]
MKEWEKKKLKMVQDKVKQEMSLSSDQNSPVDAKPEPKGMEASRSVEFVEPSQDQSAPTQEDKGLDESERSDHDQEESSEWKPPTKLIPVFFIDEAHKLPALIKDQETMKCILDGLLVLTKQGNSVVCEQRVVNFSSFLINHE